MLLLKKKVTSTRKSKELKTTLNLKTNQSAIANIAQKVKQDGLEVVLGVDPGNTSAWALVTVEAIPRLVSWGVVDTSNKPVTPIVLALREYQIRVVAIEQQYVAKGAKKNEKTAIRLGHNAGRWKEASLVAGHPVSWIEPARWQSKMLRGFINTWRARREERKEASIAASKMRWGIDLPVDAADAAIMAAYCAEILWADKKASELRKK